MKIQKAKIKDLDNIVNLSCQSALFHKELTPYYDTDKNIKDIFKKSFKKNLSSKNDLILIAKEKDKIIGYLLAFVIKRPEMFKIKKTGLIADIFVDVDYRKKRVGKKLVDEVIAWLRKKKINNVEINIEVKNRPALKFWDKFGFKDVAIEKYKKL